MSSYRAITAHWLLTMGLESWWIVFSTTMSQSLRSGEHPLDRCPQKVCKVMVNLLSRMIYGPTECWCSYVCLFFPSVVLSIFQELLTRKPPFHDIPGLKAVISRIMHGAPSRPNEKDTCGRLTDTWWNIAHSCWHHEPSCRPSISEVFQRLHQL